MANNLIYISSTQVTHIGSGDATAAGSFNNSSCVSVALDSTNLFRFPSAEVVLDFSSLSAFLSSTANTIFLFRRDLNTDGTKDDNIPTATDPYAKLVGSAQYPTTISGTSVQATCVTFVDVPLSEQCEFYIQNSTNRAWTAGWTLKVKPVTVTPS